MTSVLRQTSAFMAHQKPVVGDMKMSFVGYNHLGWMLCNGDSLLIADNVFNDTRQTAFASTGITIDNNTTGITINNNVTSITINNDGLHNHTIASNGMDQPHNNMQPTLFMGNMFIYSGVPTLGYWPYTIGMDAPEFMTPALNPPLI